jgi:hypothetical protein
MKNKDTVLLENAYDEVRNLKASNMTTDEYEAAAEQIFNILKPLREKGDNVSKVLEYIVELWAENEGDIYHALSGKPGISNFGREDDEED